MDKVVGHEWTESGTEQGRKYQRRANEVVQVPMRRYMIEYLSVRLKDYAQLMGRELEKATDPEDKVFFEVEQRVALERAKEIEAILEE